ncbi:CAAX amino terminal protease family [Saccharothrix espanaensis DSM 44229]|uniref:CAAX amino terminal protease family n=1 Tax=Saccharothrix espanaensis (strain ATCC 51144 / DSM 44229 / JCM 9112 / NBRC 15066 / NRRL 15764) TaxID=1179773 RepID=K0K005_SACES|nr:CAAX amino terminal protease family [Saccharothrix espanaensis DSM 44229]
MLISFGFAWAGMAGAWLLGFSLTNPLVQLPFGFAPALAAFVVRRWVTREGFADAGLALRLRQAWRHYLAAWLGPFALVVVMLATAAACGLWQPAWPTAGEWAFVGVLVLIVPLLTPVYWGEEFGWTSYLRLRLVPDRPVAATLATGLIWAVWHYPLAFFGYIEFGNVVVGLAVWTVSFLCQEVILGWLRISSGTVWPASLAHAGNNMVLALLTGAVLGEHLDATTTTVVMTVPLALAAGWIVLTGRLHDRVG